MINSELLGKEYTICCRKDYVNCGDGSAEKDYFAVQVYPKCPKDSKGKKL